MNFLFKGKKKIVPVIICKWQVRTVHLFSNSSHIFFFLSSYFIYIWIVIIHRYVIKNSFAPFEVRYFHLVHTRTNYYVRKIECFFAFFLLQYMKQLGLQFLTKVWYNMYVEALFENIVHFCCFIFHHFMN